MTEIEKTLYEATQKYLEKAYSYLEYDIKNKKEYNQDGVEEVSTDKLNLLTEAIKESIRYNNILSKSLTNKTIVLDEEDLKRLEKFYSYYDQLPKEEIEVTNNTGTGLIEIYNGIIVYMTPIAIFVDSFLKNK